MTPRPTIDPAVATMIERVIVPALLERLLAGRDVSKPTRATTRVESQPSA